MRIRKAFAMGLLTMTPALTGCLVHTHSVLKTRPPTIVLGTSTDQLLNQVDDRYTAIQSMTATVHIVASTGGSQKGEVTEYTALSGYIIIGKPQQIRVILELPLGVGQVLDMVSDGKTFKMLIPHKSCAIVGSDVVTNTSQKGLYALRPPVIFDSLLIQGLQTDQVVAMTQGSRIVADPKTRKDDIDEPTYNLEFFSQPEGHSARALRVIHVSRVNLLPYQQDIYNDDGKVATQAFYSNYQKFGTINFPTNILIQRPLDQYTLAITINKATFNQKLDSDQFVLDIPDGTTTQNMDSPASASVTTPCAVHAPQSPH
jgi:outer membrane lipoprotein-sorting protein